MSNRNKMSSEKDDTIRESLEKWMQEINPQPDLTYNIEDDIGQQTDSEPNEKPSQSPLKTTHLLRGLAVAAALMLVAVGGYKWYQYQQSAAVKALAMQSLNDLPPMENIYYLDSTSQDPKTQLFVEGVNFYKQKKYLKAIERLDNQLFKGDDGAQFYLAMSYMYSHQNGAKTEKILRGLIERNTIVKAEAQRYFALVLLENGKIEDAKTQLHALEKDAVFGVKAKGILAKLP